MFRQSLPELKKQLLKNLKTEKSNEEDTLEANKNIIKKFNLEAAILIMKQFANQFIYCR